MNSDARFTSVGKVRKRIGRRKCRHNSGLWKFVSDILGHPHESAVGGAIQYVRDQPNALLIWVADGY